MALLKKVFLPKNNGTFREVYSASPEHKSALRKHLPLLEALVDHHDSDDVIYGFRKGRNPVLNAFQHVGFDFTLSMDLADFFGHVRPHHVLDLVPQVIVEECFFFDGIAPQGLPTSPAIANVAFTPADKAIVQELAALSSDIVYTRYADDLTFSFNERRFSPKIDVFVNRIARAQGFSVNKSKTRFQNAKNGRIIVTGVGVDRHGVHPTRKTLKRMRAAQHNDNSLSLAGLAEWARCKLPNKRST